MEVTQAEGTGVWWERIREGSLTGSVRPQQPAQGAAQRHLALSDPVQEEPRRRRCQTGSKFGSDARLAARKRILSKYQPILTQLGSKPQLSSARLCTEPRLQSRYPTRLQLHPSKPPGPFCA